MKPLRTILKNFCEQLLLSLFKKRLQERSFPLNFVNYSRTPILKSVLRTSGSKRPVRGFFFDKFASLMAWRSLTVLESDSSAGIFLWILRNFEESFCRTPPINHFLYGVFLIFADYWGFQPKIDLFGGANKGIHKPVESCVVVEIGWKIHELTSCGCTSAELGIPVAEEVEERKELKNLLKWGKW